MRILLLFLVFSSAGFSKDLYKKHLPKDLYEFLSDQDFFEPNQDENFSEISYGLLLNTILVKVDKEKAGEYVLIDYSCKEALENFSGQMLAYRRGSLIAYVVFDEQGRDYLAYPPFSKQEQQEAITSMLELFHNGKFG